MKQKSIGIDGGTWGNIRGYGRFTRELLRALVEVDHRNQYCLFLDPWTARHDLPHGLPVVTVPVSRPPSLAASADGYRSPRDLWAFSRAIASAPIDIVFFPSVYTFVPVLPAGHPLAVVVAIHDVIPERFPQHVFNSSRARLFWTLKTRLAVKQATRVLTVSEHAKTGVQQYFHIAPNKIRVTYEAAAPAFRLIDERAAIDAVLARIGIPTGTRYIVYFGGLTPHKNIGLLIDVFSALVQEPRFADVKLILIGDYKRDVYYSAYTALRAQVDTHCPGAALFSGYLDDGDAACVLNGAISCVLPSLDEGFGLPGIEAAACGTPLIATRNSAMPQCLGDAALYIDPTKPADLCLALKRVLQDDELRRQMRVKGMARSQQLTWKSAAERVMAMFDEL